MKFSNLFSLFKEEPLVEISLVHPGEAPVTIRLIELPAVIGRSPEADMSVSDRWVSKVHCRLDVCDGKLMLHDLESRHGTLVNGDTIRDRQLNEGDRIWIGMTELCLLSCAEQVETE